ncbi:relaxase/mobilization nuclease RlxS [Sphingomonas colocasiae]|uniref:DUF3363 domain-containing protein n=1 Tax=Sphingomonas colocasiae TaxID=1848973 RepID=A0ABS7PIJ8_9SPHN|nr:relaxase/mobilization nuclease RlxS [Sphingomonas colocasiae]MBY8821073.1 DUF3363 domain-containing protein [Sphingomonas colocasiae]
MDDDGFEPRLGRLGKGKGRYVGRVVRATNLARGSGQSPLGRKHFTGARNGRGAGAGGVLAGRDGLASWRQRRVTIKTRLVRLSGRGIAGAAAHLQYLKRDGVTRDGERGTLYGPDSDRVEGSAFLKRGDGDRHQFRFIVSAEDGDQYPNLKPFTRTLMREMERDLGTKLDWVAVDHFNTAHPHTHIVLRGREESGRDLVIAKDYIARGMRERACEIVRRDLGLRSDHEIAAQLRREMGQERLTSLDRRFIREQAANGLVEARARDPFDQTLRAGRLQTLKAMGLATPIGGDHWRLSDEAEAALREMGRRGDIIAALNQAVTRAGIERPLSQRCEFEQARSETLVGRLVERGLSDELGDRHFMIVDGIDGRTHYVDIGKGENVELLPVGSILAVKARLPEIRTSDRTIVDIAAAHGGRYDVDTHLRHDPSATESFAATHVRRLEALRRIDPGIERAADGSWRIAPDHLERVRRCEALRAKDRPVEIEPLSTMPLGAQIGHNGATWLDRTLIEDQAFEGEGFGSDVAAARLQRRAWLVGQGLATETDGVTRFASGMVTTLQRRELLRVAAQLSGELGMEFAEARTGAKVEGIYRRGLNIGGQKFALIEKSREFTLVPWRPVLERGLGQPVTGIVRESGISWSIGRQRGMEIS